MAVELNVLCNLFDTFTFSHISSYVHFVVHRWPSQELEASMVYIE